MNHWIIAMISLHRSNVRLEFLLKIPVFWFDLIWFDLTYSLPLRYVEMHGVIIFLPRNKQECTMSWRQCISRKKWKGNDSLKFWQKVWYAEWFFPSFCNILELACLYFMRIIVGFQLLHACWLVAVDFFKVSKRTKFYKMMFFFCLPSFLLFSFHCFSLFFIISIPLLFCYDRYCLCIWSDSIPQKKSLPNTWIMAFSYGKQNCFLI